MCQKMLTSIGFLSSVRMLDKGVTAETRKLKLLSEFSGRQTFFAFALTNLFALLRWRLVRMEVFESF